VSVLRVAAIQHVIVWEDREANLAALAEPVKAAAGDGARVVALTEMFAVGFSMATDRTAEPPDGPTTTWLREQAAATGAWVGGSVPVLAPGAPLPTNRFTLAGPGGELHTYDKRHPFSYAGEDQHFAAGDELVTVSIEGVRVSLAVCYDLRFANQFWAQAAGTDLYLLVANWPAPRAHHWRSLLLARAIENQAYVVGVNRVGPDGSGLDHAGGSLVVDPLGEVLADAGSTAGVVAADVDPAVVADVRARLPFLQDRRP
jgi:predicted amidohydrolase